MKLPGTSTTLKPCMSETNASTDTSPPEPTAPPSDGRGASVAEQRLQRPLGQRDQEPHLEGQEKRNGDPNSQRHRNDDAVAPEPDHEDADEHRRGHVDADVDDGDDIDQRRDHDP